jgi:hypothetical protein
MSKASVKGLRPTTEERDRRTQEAREKHGFNNCCYDQEWQYDFSADDTYAFANDLRMTYGPIPPLNNLDRASLDDGECRWRRAFEIGVQGSQRNR